MVRCTHHIDDETLRKFSTFGLPEVVNATGFTNNEFEAFMKANGVNHPSSDGLVERAVQTLKKLKDGSLETELSRFLCSTGLSPAGLRRLHSPLDNLRPNLDRKMHQEQERQKSIHDRHAKPREFSLEFSLHSKLQ